MNDNKKTDFTSEQLAAINHNCEESGSAIVSAAAGSGKTAVLVEHIIRLISDENKRISANKIVTVTFTKKAAAEIKVRLEKALTIQLNGAKDGKKEWLNEQLIRLDEAGISTISAFCLDILRAYPTEAGLSPGFRTLDELEADEFMERASDNALDKLYDEEYFTAEERLSLNLLTGEIGDNALVRILYDFYKTAVKNPAPEEWLKNLSAPYEDKNFLYELVLPSLKNSLLEKTEVFIRLGEENKRLAFGTSAAGKLEKDYSLALDWNNWALGLPKSAENFKPEIKSELRTLLTRDCEKAVYGKAFSESTQAVIKDNHKNYKLIIKELTESGRLFLALEDTAEKLNPAVKALVKLFGIFSGEYEALKLSANAVDFNDMEHLCLKLLNKDNCKYGREIGTGFHEIIVDEFQDSNSVQYAVFRALSREERNLFFVGDVKQSIYRFRSADPRVFTSLTHDSNYKTLYLNKNFRSGKEVVGAVNDVFDSLMTADIKRGGTDYNENERLVQGLLDSDKAPVSGGAEAVAEICLLCVRNKNKAGEETNPENAKPPETEKSQEHTDVKRLEARYIAKRIKELIKNNFTVAEKSGERRVCGYGDFAVIMSALGTVEREFLEEFEAEGVPASRGGSGDYLSLSEVGLAIDLLIVIDNPYYNDIALMSVIMSPLYGMSANDIALVKAADTRRGLFDSLNVCSTSSEAETFKKVKRFLEDIFRWRTFAENNTPSRLIRRIYDEGTFLPIAAGSANAGKTLANLSLLLYYADNLSGFAGLDIKSLSGFIGFLSGKLNNGKKLSEAGGYDSDSVKLLTIHASKGLEFPVCFIARINSAFNKRETDADVMFDEEWGLAARYIDSSLIRYDSLPHRLAKEAQIDGMTGEEVRKLYVAMTRARDKLILVGTVDAEENGGSDITEIKPKKNTYLEFLYSSNAVKNGTLKPVFPDVSDLIDSINSETAYSWISNEAVIQDKDNIDYDENKCKAEILNAINANYGRTELTRIPKKLTATQVGVIMLESAEAPVLPETDDEPSIFPRNPSFLKEKKLTGKKRGDCYHKVMQLIDFEAGGYEEQLAGMEARFTAQEYKAIDASQIRAFFDSELGLRAVRSRRVSKEFPLYTEISFSELCKYGNGFVGGQNGDELDLRFTERPFIQGIADMFFYEDGEIILVDYKTNRRPTAEKLREEYKSQLRIYKKAIEEMTGTKVKECWLYSFEIGAVKV